jgi:hypothetical protein
VQDLPLEAMGDGRYVFKAGDGMLVDKDSRPVIVDFNQAAPFRTSGYGQPATMCPPTELAAPDRRQPAARRRRG